MKKIILSILVIMFVCIAGFSYATEIEDSEFDVIFNSNITDTLSSEEQDNLEATTTNLENPNDITNVVEDDVYLIDENVTIAEQEIQGNVYIIAEEIKMNHITVDGNIFLIGQDVEIKDSIISGSAYIIGDDFESNSQIRDLYLLGEDVKLLEDSYVDRNAKILGQTTKFNGIINNNCYISSNNIDISNSAIIGGTLSYYSSKEANIGNSENIGNINFHLQEESTNNAEKTITAMDKFYDFIGAAVKVLVIAGVMIFLSAKTIKANKEITVGTFFKCSVIGMLIFIFVPIIAMILIVSIIGIGIGLILLAIYAIMLYISSVVACLAIACTIVKEDSKWKVLGITSAIYLAIRLISIFSGMGILISMITGIAGLGFIVRNIWYKENKEAIEVVSKEI